ncbi:MAG: hypothetical protein HPY83_04270 [Anaerolineae bacterium]|nr:hypothetical protein [Anaerolineae bacterium]
MLNTPQSLLDYDTELLRAIALTRGLDASASRPQLLAALSEANSRPLSVRLLWEELSEEERRAVARLAAKGGWMPAVYFEHEFGGVRRFGPARLVRERLWEHPQSVTESLLFRGLIFRGFSPGKETAVWYLPTDAAPLIPVREEDARPPAEPTPVEGDVRIARPADDFLVRALYHVVGAARLGERPLHSAVRSRLASEPDAPDEARIEYFAALAQALAHEMRFLRDAAINQRDAGRIRTWLASPRSDALAAVAHAWLASTSWHELLRAPGLVFEGGQVPAAAPARQAIVDALERLEPARWYAVADLQDWMQRMCPDFLRSDSDFDSLYLRDGPGGAPLDGLAAWMRVEGRFLEEVLVALNALAAVSLGAAGPMRCLRVEATAWWASQEPVAEAIASPLSLGPGLTLTLAREAPLLLRYQVEAVADRGPVPGAYRLTRASVRRAHRRGIDSARLERFLEANASGFDDGSRRALAALMGPPTAWAEAAVVLEPEDEDALEDLLQDPGIKLCLEAELPRGRLLFRRERWAAAAARLRALGFRLDRRRS